MSQNAKPQVLKAGDRRKKLLGLTLGLMMVEPAAPVLANSGASGAWATPQPMAQTTHLHATQNIGGWASVHTVTQSLGHPTIDIGKSQGTLQLLPHALLTKTFHGGAVAPVFVSPHTDRATTAVGQSGQTISLDLTSSAANIILGTALFAGKSAVTITADGAAEIFRPGSTVTAAQYVAIQQVLSTGKQEISITANGAANGGDFSLNALGKNTASLVVPSSVTAIDTVTRGGNIHFSGDLTNYGAIDAVAANNRVVSGTISALDITNEAGATISATSSNPAFSLNLVAGSNIANSGTVKSTGDLTLLTGSGNLTNSGSVSAAHNVNITSPTGAADININGTGGTISAAGDINIRDKSYNGTANITLNGGDYLSQNLNLYSGAGAITGSVGQVTGNLNTVAGAEHFNASSTNLVLGKNTISGDPTFVNFAGDITINDATYSEESLTIIASGNILAGGSAAQIVDHGQNVTLIAGGKSPDSVSPPTTTVPGSQISSGTVGVDFSTQSVTGGKINLSASTQTNVIDTSSSSGKGGNITLVALANGTAGGTITLNSASTLNTSSSNIGSNGGSVTVLASANRTAAATTISLGSINASSAAGSSATAGQVFIGTERPTANGNPTYDATGALVSGSITPISTTTTTLTNAGISVGAINASGSNSNINSGDAGNGNSITLVSGANIAVNGSLSSGGGNAGNLQYAGTAGNIAVTSITGGIAFAGPLQASGGYNLNGGYLQPIQNGGKVSISAAGNVTMIGGALSLGASFGDININARSLSVTGSATDIFGTPVNFKGNHVNITTAASYISDAYFANSDLSSTANTQAVTITTGPISLASQIVATNNATFNGVSQGPNVQAGTYLAPGTNLTLKEGGNNYSIGSGTAVTAAEYIQLVQTSNGLSAALGLSGSGPGTGIASSGNFTVASQNLPTGSFSTIVLPSGVTANANVPILNVNGPVTVSGILNFVGPTAQLNVSGTVSTPVTGSAINFYGVSGAIVATDTVALKALPVSTTTGATITIVSGHDISVNGDSKTGSVSNNYNLIAGADVTIKSGQATFDGVGAGGYIATGSINTNGGNLTAVAYDGPRSGESFEMGEINIFGTISTGGSGGIGVNGNVTLIGQSAVSAVQMTGAISTSGSKVSTSGGNVTIFAADPVFSTGSSATVANGELSPPSTYSTANPTLTGGTITLAGITTSGTNGAAGTAGTPVAGAGGAGGAVTVASNGSVSFLGTSNVITTGGSGGAGYAPVGAGGNGGAGGAISLTGYGIFVQNGGTNSSGGAGGAGGTPGKFPGTGGNAGDTTLYGPGLTTPNAQGGININGVITAGGGGGTGQVGQGGQVTIAGSTVQVKGMQGGQSITAGSVTIITLATSSSDTLSANADYSSTNRTENAPVLSGSAPFTIGNASTSGTAGQISANSITINGQTPGQGQTMFTGSATAINEQGGVLIVTQNTKLTPAEVAATLQLTETGSQLLVLNGSGTTGGAAIGGTFDINQSLIPTNGFTNLVIPAGVTITSPVSLTYSGSGQINGTLAVSNNSSVTFDSTLGVNGLLTFNGVGTVNTSGDIMVNGGTITAGTSSLYLRGGTGAINLTNNAALLGSIIEITSSAISVDASSKIDGSSDFIAHTASIVNDGQIIAEGSLNGDGQILINNSNGGVALSGSGQFTALSTFSVNAVNGGISTGTFFTAAQPIASNFIQLNADGPLTLATNSISVLTDASGNGGNISIRATSLIAPSGPVAFNADATGTGKGGSVSISLTDSSDVSVGTTGTLTASARGGDISGAGGQIVVLSGGNLTVDPSALDVSTRGGAGGTYNLQANDTLTLTTNTLSANGVSGGAGGLIVLSGSTIKTATSGPLVLTANGDGAGAGGEVDYTTSSTSNTVVVDSSPTAAANAVSIHATGGDGGTTYISSGKDVTFNSVDLNPNGQGTGNGATIDVEAYAGTITFGNAVQHFDGVGGGTGGNVTFEAVKFALPAGANLDISASAASSGSGRGGNILLTTTTTTPLVIGKGTGAILLTAKAGTDVAGTNENGGIVMVSTGGNLTVQSGGISVDAGAVGTGGEIDLSAGSSNAAGNLLVAGNLDVSGHGAGSIGGQISLTSNSKTAFSIGLAKAVNGTQGMLLAGGDTDGGSILVRNGGAGGITQLQAFTSLDTLRLQTGAGAIAFNANLGTGVVNVFAFTDSGKVSSSSKAILQPSQLTVSSNSGAISLPNLQASSVTVHTGAKAAVAITNPGSSAMSVVGLTGGNVTLKSAGDLNIEGSSSVANLTVTSTSKTGSAISLTGGITTTGTVTVSTAGNIMSSGAIDATKGAKFTTSGALGNISESGTLAVGATGSVSMVATKSTSGTAIDATGSDINGGKTDAFTATKGGIVIGTIGDGTAPGAIKVTALNNISNLGPTTATTSITEKTTGSSMGNGIYIDGDMVATLANKGTVSLSSSGTNGKIFEDHGHNIGAGKSVTISASKGTIEVYAIGGGTGTTPLTATLTAANVILADSVINAYNTISEKATAAASIVFDNGGLNAVGTNGTVTISSGGGSISNVPGGIGIQGAIDATKAVTLTTNAGIIQVGDVTTNVFKATAFTGFLSGGATITGHNGVTIQTKSTDKTSNGISVGDIITGGPQGAAGGAILLKSGGGDLVVNSGATLIASSDKGTKASITLENALTTNGGGNIIIDSGAQLSTEGSFGSNVIITIGAPPGSPKFGAIPSGAATFIVNGTPTTPTASGPFYFGSGTTGTVNFVNAASDPTALQISSLGGGKVIFNTGNLPAANITVNAGTANAPTFITADPPVAASAVVPAVAASDAIAPSSELTQTSTTSGALIPTIAAHPEFVNVGLGLQINDNQITSATTHTLYGAASVVNAPQQSVFVGGSDLRSANIDASIVSDTAANEPINLKQGNIVVAPSRDTIVKTACGDVAVKAGAVALVMVQGRSTAVYNLHDNRLSSVVVTNGRDKIALAPGRHVLITDNCNTDFNWVNPAETFAYRNLSVRNCGGGLTAHTAEFSLLHSLANVRQLRELMTSKEPAQKQLAAKVLKTAVIVSQYNTRGGDYQQYQHPRMTALAQ